MEPPIVAIVECPSPGCCGDRAGFSSLTSLSSLCCVLPSAAILRSIFTDLNWFAAYFFPWSKLRSYFRFRFPFWVGTPPKSESSKFAGRLLGHFLTNWTLIQCHTKRVALYCVLKCAHSPLLPKMNSPCDHAQSFVIGLLSPKVTFLSFSSKISEG